MSRSAEKDGFATYRLPKEFTSIALNRSIADGKVTLGKKLYQSAQAVHYSGVIKSTGKPVHIKIYFRPFSIQSEGLKSWIEIKSDHLLKIRAITRNNNHDIEISDEINGKSLDQLKRPLSINKARSLAVEIGSALRSLHSAGYVHGDVSPSNIVLSNTGWVLIDTGSLGKPGQKNDKRMLIGSFRAPELFLDGHPINENQDYWSLSLCLLYALGKYTGSKEEQKKVIESVWRNNGIRGYTEASCNMDEPLFRLCMSYLVKPELRGSDEQMMQYCNALQITLPENLEYAPEILQHKLDEEYLGMILTNGANVLQMFNGKEKSYFNERNAKTLRNNLEKVKQVSLQCSKSNSGQTYLTNIEESNLHKALTSGIVTKTPDSSTFRQVPVFADSVTNVQPYCFDTKDYNAFCEDIKRASEIRTEKRKQSWMLVGKILLAILLFAVFIYVAIIALAITIGIFALAG